MREMTDPPSITCPVCEMTSYHPKDIEYRYCGKCHQFHDLMDGTVSVDQMTQEAAAFVASNTDDKNGREIIGEAIKRVREGRVES